ncbi:MAG TPA: hypothetical protein VG456_27550 [Candidatus Sulfopaludibacter sp.]|nr:hypothetical protein [Candidatus Sulfopaludibacter sp.]
MLAVLAVAVGLVSGLATAAGGEVTTGKSYKINLTFASKIGANDFAAGAYTVAVDTASVRFIEQRTGKSVEVAAKVETSDKKFDHTAITTEKTGEEVTIREIRLGGSKVQLNFR